MIYGELLVMCIEFMKTEFVLCGYTVSFWQLFVFTFIVGVIGLLIHGFLD